MTTAPSTKPESSLSIAPSTVVICVLVAISGFILWRDHQAHVLGILPYVLLAACPIVHLFMHGGHRGHRGIHGRHAPTEDAGNRR